MRYKRLIRRWDAEDVGISFLLKIPFKGPKELNVCLCWAPRGPRHHSRVHFQPPISGAEPAPISANRENGRLYRIWMRSVSFGAIFEWRQRSPQSRRREDATNIETCRWTGSRQTFKIRLRFQGGEMRLLPQQVMEASVHLRSFWSDSISVGEDRNT